MCYILFSVSIFKSRNSIDCGTLDCFSYGLKLWSDREKSQDLPTHTKLMRLGLKWKVSNRLRVWNEAGEESFCYLIFLKVEKGSSIFDFRESPNVTFLQPWQLFSSILYLSACSDCHVTMLCFIFSPLFKKKKNVTKLIELLNNKI